MATAERKGSWGGRRVGAGAKPLTPDERHRRQLLREELAPAEIGDPVEYVAERIGLSPRSAAMRPDLVERFEVVSPAEHLDRFARFFCRHTRQVPEGPALGSPFALEPFQREWVDEALAVDEDGRRVYSFAAMVVPRKNGKTTFSSLIALYMASPADGEHRPEVILAAGTLKQAGKLWQNTTAFIMDRQYGSPELRKLFLAQANSIQCPSVSGTIERIAGDGDSNHSLDPHVVVADELHTWHTPKQSENWRALTTAQGGRIDPIILPISTEGQGEENELAYLLERLEDSPRTEREQRSPYLVVYRNRDAGDLAFVYSIPKSATLADLDQFEAANPAPWRTRKRIAKDMVTDRVDEATKLRLYGNRRASEQNRWIADEVWEAARSDEEIPDGALVQLGADGARYRDTTAVAWAWENPETGKVVVRTHVWSCRRDKPFDTFVAGGRLDNDDARDFILEELGGRYELGMVFFDERYFGDQANDLDEAGLTVVQMHQGKPEMQAAWDGFYHLLHEGTESGLAHGGETDATLTAHLRACAGVKTERGWKVSKIDKGRKQAGDERPIDAVAAAVMAIFGVANAPSFESLVAWA
jgi:phage terminase large subunit-like protein